MKSFLYSVLVVALLFDVCASVYLYQLIAERQTERASADFHPARMHRGAVKSKIKITAYARFR